MIYTLLNECFGWDYILWRNTATSRIARIRQLPDGTYYYWEYRYMNHLKKLTNKDQCVWLTCKAEKYGL